MQRSQVEFLCHSLLQASEVHNMYICSWLDSKGFVLGLLLATCVCLCAELPGHLIYLEVRPIWFQQSTCVYMYLLVSFYYMYTYQCEAPPPSPVRGAWWGLCSSLLRVKSLWWMLSQNEILFLPQQCMYHNNQLPSVPHVHVGSTAVTERSGARAEGLVSISWQSHDIQLRPAGVVSNNKYTCTCRL